MEFISNLIKRPISLVLSETPTTNANVSSADNLNVLMSTTAPTTTASMPLNINNMNLANAAIVDMKNSSSSSSSSPRTAPAAVEHDLCVAAVDDFINTNLNFLYIGCDSEEQSEKQTSPCTTASAPSDYNPPSQSPNTSNNNSTIEELLIAINDNLNQVGFTDENIVTTSNDAMIATVKLSPVPTKAIPTKLTPAGAARSNINTPHASPATTTAANMEINSTLSQSCMDSILASHTLNNANQNISNSLNKSASKFMGLPEFDESTIPELPDSLNPNLEEQLKLSFEDGLIPTLTANIDTAMNANVNNIETPLPQNRIIMNTSYSTELAEAESAYKSAMQSQNLTAVGDAMIAAQQADTDIICESNQNLPQETPTEVQTTSPEHQQTRKSFAGDINFDDEAMDIDISITESEEDQLLSDVVETNKVGENISKDIELENMQENVNKTLHFTKEDKAKDKLLNIGNVTLNMNFINDMATVNAATDLNNPNDKERLPFTLPAIEIMTDNVEKSNEITQIKSEEQQLSEEAVVNKTIELPTHIQNVANNDCTIQDKHFTSATDLSFSNIVMQVASDWMHTTKPTAAPPINDSKLNLTLDMTSSFCSAKSSAPTSPTFPISPRKISTTQFPRSPTAATGKKNCFLEKSEYAESLNKEKTPHVAPKAFGDINIIPPSPEKSAHQPINPNTTLDYKPLCRSSTPDTVVINNTFNATANEVLHSASDKRRTFNLGETTTAGSSTLDKFPTATTVKLNQSDVDRRRTFNLSDAAEQQHLNETIEDMDVDVSIVLPTIPPIGLKTTLVSPLQSNQSNELLPALVEHAKPTPTFLEKSEHAECLNKEETLQTTPTTIGDIKLIPISPELSAQQPIDPNTILDSEPQCRSSTPDTAVINNTFNGTPNEMLDVASDKRRTFDIAQITTATSTTLDKSATTATAKLNQSDIDRRRTFNLSAVAEQQQHFNETMEATDVTVSMTMPTSTPIGMNSPVVSPLQSQEYNELLPAMVEATIPRPTSPLLQYQQLETNGAEAYRSNSPPLPTHQANKQANAIPEYDAVGDAAEPVARSASPLLPAQQTKSQADLLKEYGAAGDGATPVARSASPQTKTTPEMNSSYSVQTNNSPPSPTMQEHQIIPDTIATCPPTVSGSPPLPANMHKQPRQSILTAVQDFQQQPLASLSLPAAIKKRPSIHAKPRNDDNLFRSPLPFDDMLSAKEISKDKLKDEKDVFVEQYQTTKLDDMFATPTPPNKLPFGGCSSNSVSAGNHFDFQQHQQQQQFEAEFCNQNNFVFDPADFDFLLSKGNNNVQVDRSSLLLRFDPLLGVPVPVNQTQQQQQQQQQQLHQILANNNQILSPTVEEEDDEYHLQHLQQPRQENRNDNNSSFIVNHNKHIALATTTTTTTATKKQSQDSCAVATTAIETTTTTAAVKAADLIKGKQEKKDASMSVDIIKDMNIDNDCNKTFENSNKQSEDKQLNYKMDELEKKIQNEVLKTEDIEKKLKEAEQREEALIKRITEKDKTISKMNGVIEAYEKAIAELIAEKEQLIQNYEKQLAEVKADRDSNYHHLTSLETTFSDLHVKYEKSKEMTSQLKSSEESLLAEKRQNLENLMLQEQRYEKMKNHAMQQLEIANKKLETLTKEHAIESTKLKALLKKEEISRASINEQLQQKSRENAELVKICDELINGQGS